MNGIQSGKGVYLPYLDGLRGIAIVAVFFFHTLGPSFGYDQLPWSGLFRDVGHDLRFLAIYPFSYGHLGVAVFFVISGYCIHLSHAGSSGGWPVFFVRRFFRIYPAYLFALVLFLLVVPWGPPLLSSGTARQVAANIFGVQNLWKSLRFGINPSFWSIAVEIQLYLLYPLFLAFTARLGWGRALAGVAVLEFIIRLSPLVLKLLDLGEVPFMVRASPFAYWGSWALGAYLAHYHRQGRATIFAGMPLGLLFLAMVCVPIFKHTAILVFPLCALATAVVMERFHQRRWEVADTAWWWRHLCRVGVVSYSFYLFHQPLLIWCGRLLPGAPGPLLSVACLLLLYPAVLGVAHLGHRWLEQPSIAVGKRVVERMRARYDKS